MPLLKLPTVIEFIFPILNSAREPASFWRENVVAVQSTTSFSKNVVVAKTSYQKLGISSFSDWKRALSLSMEISVLTLW